MSWATRVLWASLCVAGPAVAQPAGPPASSSRTPRAQEAPSIPQLIPSAEESLDPEIRRAVQFVEKRRYLEALAVLREVIRKQPDQAEARFVAAVALIQLRRYAAARTLLEQLIQTHPQRASLYNNLAWLYATADDPAVRNPTQAVALARRALVLEPLNGSMWSTMAEAYYANREYPRSLRAAEEALALGRAQHAPPARLLAFEEQVIKCREAVLAFSIIDY